MDHIISTRERASSHEFNTPLHHSNHSSFQLTSQPVIQNFGQQRPVASSTPMEFRSPPPYNHLAGLQHGFISSYPGNFPEGFQNQVYKPQQQQQPPEQFYPTQCTPPNFQQKQQFAHSMPLQNPNSPLTSRQQSPQLSPMQRVQPPQSPQLSPMPRVHPQRSQLSPVQTSHMPNPLISQRHGGHSQAPAMFGTTQQGPQHSNRVALQHAQYPMGAMTSSTHYHSNQCSYKNDPPLGNMHTTQTNGCNMDEGRQLMSPGHMAHNSYQSIRSALGNRFNGNPPGSIGLVVDLLRRNRPVSSQSQAQNSSYASPTYTQLNTSSTFTTSGYHQQSNNSQGSQMTVPKSHENLMTSNVQKKSSIISYTPEQRNQNNSYQASFSSTLHEMLAPPSMHNLPRSPAVSSQITPRATSHSDSMSVISVLPSFTSMTAYNERLDRSGCFNPTLTATPARHESFDSAAATDSVNSMAFAAGTSLYRPGGSLVRGARGTRRGTPRGRGRGRGLVAATAGETSENANPVQWFKCPEPTIASSFQSDIEAMQADIDSYVIETTANHRTQAESMPTTNQGQQSQLKVTSEPSKQNPSVQRPEESRNISASKAAALEMIQIKQEMIDNIKKVRAGQSGSAKNDSSISSTASQNVSKPTVSSQPGSMTSNGPTTSVSSGTVHLVGQSHKDGDSSSSQQSSGDSKLKIRNQPVVDLRASHSVQDDSAVDLSTQADKSKLLSKETLPPNKTLDKPAQNQSVSLNPIKTCMPLGSASPLNLQEKLNGHKQESRVLSAREKVFDMWKAGQVVGRAPVRGKARGRGSISAGRVIHIKQEPLRLAHSKPCPPKNQSKGVNATCNVPKQDTSTGRSEQAKAPNKVAESSKVAKSLCYVMLHGHKLICLKSCHEALLLLCQFQFECFQGKGLGSVNNCTDRALRIKKRGLDHPDKGKILNYLKMNGYNLDSGVQTINLDDARRVYHYMYKVSNCSNATCVVELFDKPVDLLDISPSKNRTLTREIIMRVKKEKESANDKSYGTLSSGSRSQMLPQTERNKDLRQSDMDSLLFNTQQASSLPPSASVTDSCSPRSDHTVAYGEDRDSSDLIVVHAFENPYILRWSGDEPRTGGLCNTLVGQLRSYMHKGENYLVVDDLCNALGPSFFHDGIEKENIILYSCCQEIANFLNSININFQPLQSLHHSLVKEKDIGVYITDSDYVPIEDSAGCHSGGNLKRPCFKQEILDDYCSSPKQAKLEAAAQWKSGCGEGECTSNASTLCNRSEEATGIAGPSAVSKASSLNSSAGNLKVMPAVVAPLAVAEPTVDKASYLSQTNPSVPVLNNREDGTDTAPSGQVVANSTVSDQEASDNGFVRPHSASSPDSYKSNASTEIHSSPSLLSEPTHPSNTPTPAPVSGCSDVTNMLTSGTRAPHLPVVESPAYPQPLHESSSNDSSEADCLIVNMVQEDSSFIENGDCEKQLSTMNNVVSRHNCPISPTELKNLQVDSLKSQLMLPKTHQKDDTCVVVDKHSSLCSISQDLSSKESVQPKVLSECEINFASKDVGSDSVKVNRSSTPQIADNEVIILPTNVKSNSSLDKSLHESGQVSCKQPALSAPTAVSVSNSSSKESAAAGLTPDNSSVVLVNGFRVQVLTKTECEDLSYDPALMSSLGAVSGESVSLDSSVSPWQSAKTSQSTPRATLSSSSSQSAAVHRSVDDIEVMNSSSSDVVVVPSFSACISRQSQQKAYAKLCEQNRALINIVHVLRKELAITKQKAEKTSKYYEGVIYEITSNYKDGNEETPVVIDDSDES